MFQSLLLQVSFKTRRMTHIMRSTGFNPFSFRSPSKRNDQCNCTRRSVSIPSPSGLLQNRNLPLILWTFHCFNPFSFRSPSKRGHLPMWCGTAVSIPSPSGLLQNGLPDGFWTTPERFNPFSFRSPSKHERIQEWADGSVSIPSPSGLLQNFGYGAFGNAGRVSIPSPSGLLQNPNGLEVTEKEAFQSLLLQVSFKTSLGLTSLGPNGFNPFSFRSPSKL